MSLLLPLAAYILPMLILMYQSVDLYMRKPKIVNLRIVLLCMVIFMIWFAVEYMITNATITDALWLNQYVIFPVNYLLSGLSISIYLSITRLDRHVPKWLNLVMGFAPTIAILSYYVTGHPERLIQDVTISGVWKKEIFGPDAIYFQLVSMLYVFIELYILVYAYRKAKSPRERKIYSMLLQSSLVMMAWILFWSICKTVSMNQFGFPLNMEIFGGFIFTVVVYKALIQYGIIPYFLEKYEALYDINPSAIILLDEFGLIRDYNPKAQEILGTLEAGTFQHSILANLRPIGESEMTTSYTQLFSQGRRIIDVTCAIHLPRRKTRYVILESDYLEVDNETMKILIMHDVTELKRAEALIKASEDRYREFFEHTPVMILSTDETYRILHANPVVTAATGFTEQEMIGKNLMELLHEDSAELVQRSLDKDLRTSKQVMDVELRLTTRSGDEVDGLLNARIADAGENQPRIFMTIRDVTERKQAERQISHLAYHDSLTGLPNRLSYFNRLKQHIAYYPDKKAVVMLLDLDHFKEVNDTMGHHAGDELLKQVAQRLKQSVREEDVVARLGGDEFCILLTSIRDLEEAVQIATRITKKFEKPIRIDGRSLLVTTSIGLSEYPKDGQSEEALMKCADDAMYHAKRSGRSRFEIYGAMVAYANTRK